MANPEGPWRETAIEMLPELADEVAKAETPYLMWFEIKDAFEKAYRQTPRDESLIRRIYRYAYWCTCQPHGTTAEDDLGTCVAVCFYEHIPLTRAAREDMPRWFTLKDIDHPKSIFRYHLDDDQWQALREYLRANHKMYVPGLQSGEPTPVKRRSNRKCDR